MKKLIVLLAALIGCHSLPAQKKVVFIILDGIPADVLEQVYTPAIDEIAATGGYTRAYLGGKKDGYSESPTISAVGYNTLITGTWANKHNVWGNAIKKPNYHYWNIFRLAEKQKPELQTAIFSTWLDNRTKLVGEGLSAAGGIRLDYSFDGFEHDTVSFPHDSDRLFIFNIDEHVSRHAAEYIEKEAPDLSWVYLEYTDDIGHKFGDGPQMEDAVRKADTQVNRIWQAIKSRQKETEEEWMIIVTTDHGRDEKTGKHHGGQSKRERTIWIVTNYPDLNERFQQKPAMVDIYPTMARYLELEIPERLQTELDGVPFIGEVSISNLKVEKNMEQVHLTWNAFSGEDGKVAIYKATTNHFTTGGEDEYQLLGTTDVGAERYVIDLLPIKKGFHKILVKAPHNWLNVWVE